MGVRRMPWGGTSRTLDRCSTSKLNNDPALSFNPRANSLSWIRMTCYFRVYRYYLTPIAGLRVGGSPTFPPPLSILGLYAGETMTEGETRSGTTPAELETEGKCRAHLPFIFMGLNVKLDGPTHHGILPVMCSEHITSKI